MSGVKLRRTLLLTGTVIAMAALVLAAVSSSWSSVAPTLAVLAVTASQLVLTDRNGAQIAPASTARLAAVLVLDAVAAAGCAIWAITDPDMAQRLIALLMLTAVAVATVGSILTQAKSRRATT